MKRLIQSFVSAAALAVAVASVVHAAESPLLAALRAHDLTRVRALLVAGENPNARDETGASALMYAALYSSDETMGVLIDAGADVNGANAYGSTALMWAAGDIAKVRMLVEHGANVSARATDGTTPLLAATLHGNTAAMRLLLQRGVDPKAAAGDQTELLDAAYSPWIDEDVRTILTTAGVPLRASELRTPLANNLLRPEIVERLLKAGASPKEIFPFPTMRLPILLLSASAGDLRSTRALIEAGADPREPGPRALTPLMLAASAPSPDLAALHLLIDRGADPAARDQSGRTALDWALLQGETAAAGLLRQAGVTGGLPPAPPAPVASPRSSRDAVAKAVALLQPISPAFSERTKCISCHNQSLPSMAIKLASDRGIARDATLAEHPSRATLNLWASSRERVVLGHCPGPGFLPASAYGLVALDEEGVSPSFTTDAVASCLATRQDPEGSWSPQDIRPPLGGTQISFTALVVRGLSRVLAAGLGRSDEGPHRQSPRLPPRGETDRHPG